MFWLEEYHVDGFRWDTPKHMVFTTNGIFITNGWTLVAEVLARDNSLELQHLPQLVLCGVAIVAATVSLRTDFATDALVRVSQPPKMPAAR